MIYMISYDLHSPTQNRENVENDIKSFGTWCKYLTTTFLISTSSDLKTVSDKCVSHLDGNDAMIITKVTKPIKGWLNQKQWDWISENLQ
ncbi:MAG: hypothetical protein HFJ40_05580 [Clostridia bacterium]|nr:hypothetical protein [Clostridia bacterium]